MSITYYLNHNMILRVLSMVLVMMMLIFCIATPAKALSEVVGIALIASILSAFGIAVSSTGAIDSFYNGLDSLMSEFSSSVHGSSTWLRDQFNARLSFVSWGVLKLGGVLVDAIQEFISWLRTDMDLSSSSPIISLTPIDSPIDVAYLNARYFNFLGVNYPLFQADFYFDEFDNYYAESIDFSTLSQTYITLPDSLIPYDFDLFPDCPYHLHVTVNSDNTLFENLYLTFDSSPGTHIPVYGAHVYRYRPGDRIKIYYGFRFDYHPAFPNAPSYYFLAPFASATNSLSSSRYRFTYKTVYSWNFVDDFGFYNDGVVINDDNLDLSYLVDEDDNTKDVFFYPALTGVTGIDLSNVGNISEAVDAQLDYTKELTGTAEVTGEMDITSDFSPGTGGGDLPQISIPSGGWFLSIWHYVVQALQESAAGIAFIFSVIQSVIPSSIINLCWAACVLLIVFGIINKFLK